MLFTRIDWSQKIQTIKAESHSTCQIKNYIMVVVTETEMVGENSLITREAKKCILPTNRPYLKTIKEKYLKKRRPVMRSHAKKQSKNS